MATSNRDRVGRAFERLAVGLGPWVDGEMRMAKGDAWLEEVAAARRNPDAPVSTTDPFFLLKAMWDYWVPTFEKVLGRAERTIVNELIGTRNRWAHNEAFSFDDTYRSLDSIERLLSAVGAGEPAGEVASMKSEVLRQRYEADTKKATPRQEQLAIGAVAGLRPWRDVVDPHPDVATGSFQEAEFAANLGRVARGEGAPEYVNPVEFFRRTYVTEGLHRLLRGALARANGSGGDPVVDLQTSFGGGKTHSMLALYHLFSGVAVSALPQELQELVRGAGLDALPSVRRVVLVGTELRPGEPTVKDDGTEVHTLWGELAWQLGGAEAYAQVATVDRNATSPGDTLGRLFTQYGPCLVLIDEWVAYARQLYTRDDLPGGTLDVQVTFAQTLTEQAAATPGTLVVVSIPASADGDGVSGEGLSEIEVGGTGGKEALKRLRSVVGRMDSPWAPATAQESFEIVRRRLFDETTDPERLTARDVTARAFSELYRRQSAEFPMECREPGYQARIEAAYPIHPEMFERLYEDWSTLERFQRTRGVLRLMAAVIHTLWARNDQAPLILPAGVPLDDPEVASELLKYLPDSWKPILDADIDGPSSTPVELDRAVPNLGRYQAARRVARAIFLASAPRAGTGHPGVEAQRIRLGCVIPGESVATFGDALNRLSDRSTYLYQDNARYWYSLQQSVTRRAQERADALRSGARLELHDELLRRLRTERERGDFGAVHVGPETSGEVPDDADSVRLVILDPALTHVPRSASSAALDASRDLLERRGNAAREFRNLVVFMATDQRRIEELEQAAAEYLAWSSIVAEVDELDLTAQQTRQAREKQQQADDAVRLRLAEAYSWVLVPTQHDPTGEIAWETVRCDGQGALAAKASKKLGTEGHLGTQYPAALLRLQLDGPLAPLWAEGHVSVRHVWDCYARYLYLPRLRDMSVLAGAVEQGPASITWETDGFALAAADDAVSGRYAGLVVRSRPETTPTGGTLIVRPEVALGQLEEEVVESGPGPELGAGTAAGTGPGPGTAPGPEPSAAKRRFHGSATVDLSRPGRDFEKLIAEVIRPLTEAGAEVEVTVEIAARHPDGFSEHTVRTVTENARTLGVDPAGFEEQ